MATATVQPGPVVGRTRAGCKLVATVGGGRLTPSDGSGFPGRQRGPAGTGSVDGPMMDMLGPPGDSWTLGDTYEAATASQMSWDPGDLLCSPPSNADMEADRAFERRRAAADAAWVDLVGQDMADQAFCLHCLHATHLTARAAVIAEQRPDDLSAR